MRYSLASAAVLAFVSSVLAAATPGFDAISSPTQDQLVTAGDSLDIVWAPENVTGTITITLLQGPAPNSLSFGPIVAANIENSLGKFTWTDTSGAVGFATYGFEISLDSAPTTIQYSNPFHINGAKSNSSSSSYTGTPSTTTYHVATGTAYSTTTTSVNSTISATPTSSANSTITLLSNSTLSTTTTPSTSATQTPPSVSVSTTGSAAPTATNGAANIATGGLAMVGGLLFALAF